MSVFFVHARQTFLKTHSARKKRNFWYRALSISLSLSLLLCVLAVSAAPEGLINFAISSLPLIYMTWQGGRHEARHEATRKARGTSARTRANTKQIMCCILCGTRNPRGATQNCFMAKRRNKKPVIKKKLPGKKYI